MVPPKIHHVWCWTWLARPVLQGFAGRVPGPKAKGEDFRPHPENVGYSYTNFPGPLHGRLPPPVVLSSVNGRLFWEPGPNKNTAAREAAKVAVFFLCLAHLGPSQMVRITVTPGGESMNSKSPWTELV